MKKLLASQKKMTLVAAIVIAAFLVVWSMIYLPLKARFNNIKVQLAAAESQIQDIESVAKGARNLDEGIVMVEKKFDSLKSRLPSTEEEALRTISSYAQKLNIRLVYIRPSPKRALLDENQAEIKVMGKTCYAIFFTISARCRASELVRYLEMLDKDLPAFTTVEKLQVNRDQGNTGILSVNIDMNLYLMS